MRPLSNGRRVDSRFEGVKDFAYCRRLKRCSVAALILRRLTRSKVEGARAIEEHAWDGRWYTRAWFDDGLPLGSGSNAECQIDSIAQIWAVLSGQGDRARAEEAMSWVERLLVRERERLILLFTPPFDKGPQQPGYIRGYVPGIRENGGQYTHAATWVVMATALLARATGPCSSSTS